MNEVYLISLLYYDLGRACCWTMSNSCLSLLCPAGSLNAVITTVWKRQANAMCFHEEGTEDVF